eukprot:snap_masked-scaffold_6-processed-gene-0.45-mRNA-1 protein AED:1.00 eAED:1.00 QI:0/-1/0/0/-1/1/1/0/60
MELNMFGIKEKSDKSDIHPIVIGNDTIMWKERQISPRYKVKLKQCMQKNTLNDVKLNKHF